MDRDSIKEVVKDVFGVNYPMRDLGEWVSMPCPVAQWTHERGADNSPSFGIHVSDNDTSVCSCFSCGTKMPLHKLIAYYGELSGQDFSSVVKEVEKEEFLGPRTLQDWDSIKARNMEDILQPIDEDLYMGLYPPAFDHPYVRRRGISRRTAEKLGLRYDPGDTSEDRQKRILFPVYGPDGLLYGFSGRAVHKSAVLKVKDYYGLKKAHCLLGSHLVVQDDPESIFLVEGLFDYANCWQQGIPAVASMHAHPTAAQIDLLVGLGKKVYIALDNDMAGRDGARKVAREIHQYVPAMEVTYPEVWIDDDSEEGGHYLKDPGEATKEELEEMIDTASLYIDYTGHRRYSFRRR